MINAYIVEDEPKGLLNLKQMLAAHCPDVTVIGEAGGVKDGYTLFTRPEQRPDVAFLDINLSDGKVFQLLNQLRPIDFEIIFVTAWSEFAINASNYRHWFGPVRSYIDDCLAGNEGPREKEFNMRWIASLVADCYRIMVRGGVFLYPGDQRKGYTDGRLRLVYEANPIAFLVEQAGGSATNTVDPILDLVPTSLHQRTPLVFGSKDKVARIAKYHQDPGMISERSPLFGNRGLFRA